MAFGASIPAELARQEKRLSVVVKHQLDSTHFSLTEWAYYSGFGPTVATRPADSGGSTKQWYPYLKNFKPSRSSNNPLTGKLTQSDITFEILTTNDHALQQMVGTEDPGGGGASGLNLYQDIAAWIGSPGTGWGDWERIFTGKITDIKLSGDGTRWAVTATSGLTRARGNAMTNADKTDLLVGGDMDAWADSGPNEPYEWSRTVSGSSGLSDADRPRHQHTEGGSSAQFDFDGSGSKVQIDQTVTVTVSTVYNLEVFVKGDAADLPFEVAFENATTGNWLSVPETSPGAATVSSTWTSETWLACVPGNAVFTRRLYRFKTEGSGLTLKVYIRGTGSGMIDAQVHVDDVSLTKRIIVSGNPADLAMVILSDPTGDGAYTFAPGGLTWLAGEPDGAGLSVSSNPATAEDILGATFEDQRDTYMADDAIDVTFDEPIQALSYLEQQFLKLWGFLYIGPKAMICFQAYHAPEPTATPVSLGASEISKVKSWRRRMDLLTNSVRIFGDYTPGGDPEYTQLALKEDTAGIAADGLKELVIKSRWLQTTASGVVVAVDTANRIFNKFNRAQEEVKLELQVSQLDLSGIDTVHLTNANLPDLVTRSRGITDAPFEVVSVGPDILRGKVPVTLLRSFYDPPGFIADNAAPDWLSADAGDKQYAYISDNADQQMSDGAPGYKQQNDGTDLDEDWIDAFHDADEDLRERPFYLELAEVQESDTAYAQKAAWKLYIPEAASGSSLPGKLKVAFQIRISDATSGEVQFKIGALTSDEITTTNTSYGTEPVFWATFADVSTVKGTEVTLTMEAKRTGSTGGSPKILVREADGPASYFLG